MTFVSPHELLHIYFIELLLLILNTVAVMYLAEIKGKKCDAGQCKNLDYF